MSTMAMAATAITDRDRGTRPALRRPATRRRGRMVRLAGFGRLMVLWPDRLALRGGRGAVGCEVGGAAEAVQGHRGDQADEDQAGPEQFAGAQCARCAHA